MAVVCSSFCAAGGEGAGVGSSTETGTHTWSSTDAGRGDRRGVSFTVPPRASAATDQRRLGESRGSESERERKFDNSDRLAVSHSNLCRTHLLLIGAISLSSLPSLIFRISGTGVLRYVSNAKSSRGVC